MATQMSALSRSAIRTIFDASSTMSLSNGKPIKWILDSCCSKHMSKNQAHFSDFVKCKGVVQVRNNDVIPSYGIETVQMAAVIDEVKHYIVPNGVTYIAKIMHDLVSISHTRKKHFKVRIDDDPSNATVETMELYCKPSGKVKMCGVETVNGLYQAIARACVSETHVC